MQPQGLGALVPQIPGAQPPANPVRLNAAMDVVTSDAEEQVLDPRTLAVIKYKDALQAMQAADQLMAASQPAPTPPTVAERMKLAAEQGIMGMASRLAPGVQQQGNQMAAQQARQMMGGGLPTLPAPNMARMAGGGIVAFQNGGRPEDRLPTLSEERIPTLSELLQSLGAGARFGKDLVTAPFRAFFTAGEYGPTLEEMGSAVAAGYRGENYELPGLFERRAPRPEDAATEPTTAPLVEEPPRVIRREDWNAVDAGRGVASLPTPRETTLERMRAEAERPVTRVPGVAGEPQAKLAAAAAQLMQDRMGTDYADRYSQDIERRAREAYAVPEELRELYASRLAQLDRPMLSPEEEKMRALQGFLSGLASSSYIAQSGPAAARAVNEVTDAVRQDSLNRAQQQFELASNLATMDREGSVAAFGAGLDAAKTAMNQQGVALQMAVSTLNAADQREQAALIQESQNRMESFKAEMDALKLAAESGRADRKDMLDFFESLRMYANDINRAISSLQTTALPNGELPAETRAAVEALRAQLDNINTMAAGVRLQVGSNLGVSGVSPDIMSLVEQYTNQSQ